MNYTNKINSNNKFEKIIELIIGKEYILSFLSGIFSNIPLTLLFSAKNYGQLVVEHLYFYFWLLAIISSSILTLCSMHLAITVIDIEKEINLGMGAEGKNLQKKLQIEKNKKKLKKLLLSFIISLCMSIAMVICMTIISLFVKFD